MLLPAGVLLPCSLRFSRVVTDRAVLLSCVAWSGPKGEGGLDDATGASGAAGGASYKQTSKAAQLSESCTLGSRDADEELLMSCTACSCCQQCPLSISF
jgi:hypothetical protein